MALKDIILNLKNNVQGLTKLNLINQQLGDNEVIKLTKSLRKNTNLQELYLPCNLIGLEGAKAIAGLIKVNSSLKKLNIADNKIPLEGKDTIISALNKNKSLTEVKIEYSRDPSPEQLVINMICRYHKKGIFSSDNERMTKEFLKIQSNSRFWYAYAWRDNSHILDQDSPIDSQQESDVKLTKEVLSPELVKKSHEAYLNFLHNLTDPNYKEMTTSAATSSETSLYYLNFNILTPEEWNKLHDAISANCYVEEIWMYGACIGFGKQGAKLVATALNNNSSLKKIRLQSCDIEDEGIYAISEALKVNKTLAYINLLNNQIGKLGAEAIANALNVNESLMYLMLSGNKIGGEGAVTIANALKVNKNLISLSLKSNEIDDQGAFAIAEALEINKTLTYLDLSGNNIGHEGTIVIAQALSKNHTLKSFYLNYIIYNAQELKEALTKHPSIKEFNGLEISKALLKIESDIEAFNVIKIPDDIFQCDSSSCSENDFDNLDLLGALPDH